MKTRHLIWTALAVAALGLTSCEKDPETIDYMVTFEHITSPQGGLGDDGYFSGMGGTANTFEIVSENCAFTNFSETGEWGFWWYGFAVSTLTDAETPGVANQYSTVAGSGAYSSKTFALVGTEGVMQIPANGMGYAQVKSLMMTNSTYAYLSMRDGDSYAKQFADGDWFKVIIKGYQGESETGSVDYYLADFRDGKTFLSNSWEMVDISSLGEVDKVTFSFESSDNGEYGMNTPAYVCIDNIHYVREIPE